MITISGLGQDAAPPATAATVPTAVPMSAVDSFLMDVPNPAISDVVHLLKMCNPGPDQDSVAQELVAKGVPQATVTSAQSWLATSSRFSVNKNQLYGWLAIVSAAASAFHGYRRNRSVGWAIAWFVMGGIFPVVTPVIALAQGYGQPKGA